MTRKEWIERRLLELSYKEDKDQVDLEEEKRLDLELASLTKES